MAADPATDTIHASCVCYRGRGLLILGASGSGKSGLALQLMAGGADLVADDRVILRRIGGGLTAECPATIRGRIEARGIGILAAATDPAIHAPVPIVAVVDLDRIETERLPPMRLMTIMDVELPVILGGAGLSFAAAVLQYLKSGRLE